jgi:hypothetical protein
MNQPGTDLTEIRYRLNFTEVYSQLLRLAFRRKHYVYLSLVMLFGAGLACLPGKFLLGLPFFVFPPLFVFFYRRAIRNMVRQHPEFLEEQLLSFNAEGISISNSTLSVHWPWSRVKEISDSGEFLLIKADQFGSGGILPKRAITPQEQQRILAYAKDA